MAAPTLTPPLFGGDSVRRERKRRVSMDIDERQAIVDRVVEFADNDITNRHDDRERRLQRYAKYRQWTEGKNQPWENSSDIALPDIAEAVLNLQDTLTNAILSSRPVVGAKSTKKENSGKERAIDQTLDHQFFVEQNGEHIVEELGESFLVDGKFVAFIPWIREKQPVTDLRIFDPIPLDTLPSKHFQELLKQEFPAPDAPQGAPFWQTDEDGWEYRVQEHDADHDDPDTIVKFYTADDRSVEMLVQHDVLVFDGPRVLVKDYDDVLVPPRVANLQIPGPSNPGGAPHVILVDQPTVDEVRKLIESGFYDLATEDDLDALGIRARDDSDEEAKRQKDTMSGATDEPARDNEHKTMTRYTCFDRFDLDGDGRAEDVMWWVLREDKVLLKAKPLTEMYPADPPRRPLAEAQFLPVKGRHEGISLIELMEGMHDFLKQTLDLTIDGGTLAMTPFFFYRAASSLKPEVIRPWPGDGVPLADPQRDVLFPQIPFDGSFGLNAFFVGKQQQERLTSIGDLQSGRVPQGKSSALRTVGGIDRILAQGEARPERILRRFFMGFAEIYKQMHELNQHFWPDEKQIRVLGIQEPGDNPYPKISRGRDLKGRFTFDFRASILNSSKTAKQQGLMQMLSMLVNPLMMQLGLVTPDHIHRMLRDLAQTTGNDPDRYLQEPTPGASRPKITWREAVSVIADYLAPDGLPAEGAQAHMEGLRGFAQSDDFGLFDEAQVNIFGAWAKQIAGLAKQEQEQEQLAQAAQEFQGRLGGGQGGEGETPPVDDVAPTQQNELRDETLPGNGRGIG